MANLQEEAQESEREFEHFWQGLGWIVVVIIIGACVWLGVAHRHEIGAYIQAVFSGITGR